MYYLRYKSRIFLFHRKLFHRNIPLLRCSFFFFFFFVFLAISWTSKSVMSWDLWRQISTRVTVYFLICLPNHNSLCHETWSPNKYKHVQYFSEIILMTASKFQARFKFSTCPNYSITKYVKFSVFDSWKGELEGLKMVNMRY